MLSTDLQREATEAAVEANGQVRGQHPRGRGRWSRDVDRTNKVRHSAEDLLLITCLLLTQPVA